MSLLGSALRLTISSSPAQSIGASFHVLGRAPVGQEKMPVINQKQNAFSGPCLFGVLFCFLLILRSVSTDVRATLQLVKS